MKRGRLDTIIEVLEILGESSATKRAEIMARANVNHTALMAYLRMLEASGLIDSVPAPDRRIHEQYLLTPKGFAFLDATKRALSLLVVQK